MIRVFPGFRIVCSPVGNFFTAGFFAVVFFAAALVSFLTGAFSSFFTSSFFTSTWKFDLHNEEDYTSLELYVKPEESVAYYVFNGDITGHFFI